MRALIQRVTTASVTVDGKITGAIQAGICVFLGIGRLDTEQDGIKLADKVTSLRIFPDENGRMNRSLRELPGDMLVVPQFTLYGDTSRGNRPSYAEAAAPEKAEERFDAFLFLARERCRNVASGVFRAHMQVRLENDGPVTLLCDTRKFAS